MGRKPAPPAPGTQLATLTEATRAANEAAQNARDAIRELEQARLAHARWISEGAEDFAVKLINEMITDARIKITEAMHVAEVVVKERCMKVQDLFLGKTDNELNMEVIGSLYRALIMSGAVGEVSTVEAVKGKGVSVEIIDVEDALNSLFK